MPFLKRTEREAQHANQLEKAPSPAAASGQKVTFLAVFLGLVASIGGFVSALRRSFVLCDVN
jgi:SP family sugar:H+ symporter-like MFS transporter